MGLFKFISIIYKKQVSKITRFEGIVSESKLQGYAQKESYPQYAFKYYKEVQQMTRTNINSKRAQTRIEGFKQSLVQRLRC